MESKLLVGGKNIIDHTNEQQKMLEMKRTEIAEQVDLFFPTAPSNQQYLHASVTPVTCNELKAKEPQTTPSVRLNCWIHAKLLSDAQREGDPTADDGPGRRDSGAEGHVHLPATGGGGQDQEAQKGEQPWKASKITCWVCQRFAGELWGSKHYWDKRKPKKNLHVEDMILFLQTDKFSIFCS